MKHIPLLLTLSLSMGLTAAQAASAMPSRHDSKTVSSGTVPPIHIKPNPGSFKDYVSVPLQVHTLAHEPDEIAYHPSALLAGDHIMTFILGMPVVSSPYLGERPAFDGSDLMVNISSINQDLRLMKKRHAIYRVLRKLGYPEPLSPLIALSGAMEAQTFRYSPYTGKDSWDLDVSTAKFDVAPTMNPWVEGYFSFAYDPSYPSSGGRRIDNSNVSLSKGFINIGNLDRSPLYATLGQLYVPFGRYSSAMIASPLTLSLGRTMARAAILGFTEPGQYGWYGATYLFRSDTTLTQRSAVGANLGYTFQHGQFFGDLGASITNSLNESSGMQATANGSNLFAGFGSSVATEAVKKVPAVDVHAQVNLARYTFTGEWVGAVRRFRQGDLSFNSRGAKPQAVHVEAAHNFKLYDRPAALSAAYGWSDNALALGLPKHRLAAIFNISLWRDTVQTIELRHDRDYGSGDQGSGIGATTAVSGTGRSANTVTAQFGVYF